MTCENYNCKDANSVEREQERTLCVKDLSRVNYDPEKSDRNVILEHDNKAGEYKTFTKLILKKREKRILNKLR